MSNAHGMPPYSEIVFYDSTLRRLEPKHVGLLCWLIANAEPLGDGAWGITNTTQDEIAESIGIGVNTIAGWLKCLSGAGFIHTTGSKGLGRGSGGLSQTHYLTYHPSLPRSGDPDKPPSKRNPKNRVPQNRETKNSDLYVLPMRANGLDSPETQDSSNQQHVLSVSKTEQTEQAPHIPSEVKKALDSIHWDFKSFPIAPDTDFPSLLAVITYAKSQSTLERKAGFVNSRLKSGITKAAGELGLTTQVFSDQRRTPPSLTGYEYDMLAERHPDWDKAVRMEAARRARQEGLNHVPPRLKWEIGTEMGLPEDEPSNNSVEHSVVRPTQWAQP